MVVADEYILSHDIKYCLNESAKGNVPNDLRFSILLIKWGSDGVGEQMRVVWFCADSWCRA